MFSHILMLFISSSNDDRLDYGVIICTFGVRYRYYCSSIIRTMLVQPTEVCKIFCISLVGGGGGGGCQCQKATFLGPFQKSNF